MEAHQVAVTELQAAALTGGAHPCDVAFGRDVVRVLEAAQRSRQAAGSTGCRRDPVYGAGDRGSGPRSARPRRSPVAAAGRLPAEGARGGHCRPWAISQWYLRRGRIDRRTWWLQYTLPLAGLAVLGLFADLAMGNTDLDEIAAGGSPYGPIVLAVALLTAPASISASASRLHDRGMPAWWLLLGLVPYLGGAGAAGAQRLPARRRPARTATARRPAPPAGAGRSSRRSRRRPWLRRPLSAGSPGRQRRRPGQQAAQQQHRVGLLHVGQAAQPADDPLEVHDVGGRPPAASRRPRRRR